VEPDVPPNPFWVKICGVTRVDTAEQLIELHQSGIRPDAVGLNFFVGSKRYVSPEVAARIVERLPADITPIGLFVNHTETEIRSICKQCRITTIQLHGDETPEFLARLKDFELIRAFRVGDAGLSSVDSQLGEIRERGVTMARCVVDSLVAGTYGGSGERAPWTLLRQNWKPHWPDLILAGGLTPDNVTDAIATAGPHGVDVASGVEASPGVQDMAQVAMFLQRARDAGSRRSDSATERGRAG